jgi:hypothetical protein
VIRKEVETMEKERPNNTGKEGKEGYIIVPN